MAGRQPSGAVPRRYRLPLIAYPRAFRRLHGADTARFIMLQRSEPRYARPVVGAVRFWGEVIGDAVTNGGRQRIQSMLATFAPTSRRSTSRAAPPRRPRMLVDSLGQDIRFAGRAMRRAPGYAAVAGITLALGIGANTAIFSIVNAVVLRPLPFRGSDALVHVMRLDEDGERSSLSPLDYRDWHDDNSTFANMASWTEGGGTFLAADRADLVPGVRVSANFFDVLGVPPVMGRTLRPEDDVQGAPRVLVLSHWLWRQRFGGDSVVVGTVVSVDDEPHEIIGVMPASFYFPDRSYDYWTAIRGDELLREMGIAEPGRGLAFMEVIGRLDDGVTRERAAADLDRVIRDVVEAGHRPRPFRADVRSMHEWVVGDVRGLLMTFSGAVMLVLAIACANVANLALTRAVARRREIALRAALGAGRGRLVRQALTESVLVGMLGGAGGIAVAHGAVALAVRLAGEALPRGQEVQVDGTVLAFAFCVAVFSGLLFGALPAWHTARTDVVDVIKEGGRGTPGALGHRVQQFLAAVQVAVAVTLLVGAGLLANSFLRLTAVDPGFRPDHLLSIRVGSNPVRYDTDERIQAFHRDAMEGLRALPGVTNVSFGYSPPFSGTEVRQTIVVEGVHDSDADAVWAGTVIVGPEYFETAGIPLVAGRGVTHDDRAGSPLVVVVNQTMADRFWPGQDPIGKRFHVADGISGSVESLDRRYYAQDWLTVVGVAADVRRAALDGERTAEFYRPHAQMSWGSMTFLIRTNQDPTTVISAAQRAIWSVDPTLPHTQIETMDQLLARSVAAPRFRTGLLITFGVMAAVLASIGVYGVMAFSVSQRNREVGIRMALGARDGQVTREVLARGVGLAAAGAGIGLAGAIAGARVLETMVFGISTRDPLTYVATVLGVLVVATFASYLPARRASRVDPMEAMR